MPEAATRQENAPTPTVELEGLPLSNGTEATGPLIPVEPEQAPALPCANCGTALAGPFCFRCGQHDKDYHRSLWRFFTDFLDNTFCWDNKFVLTVRPLLRRPGFLTQEFMAGRRARYVHPLRLFLFTSAVCLGLIGFINHHLEHGPGSVLVKVTPDRKGDHGHVQASVGDDPKKAAANAAAGTKEAADDEPDTDEAKEKGAAAGPAATGGKPTPTPPGEESFAAKIQQVLAASTVRNAGAVAAGSPAAPSPGASPGPPVAQENAAPAVAPMPSEANPGEEAVRQARQTLRDSGFLPAERKTRDGRKAGVTPPGGPDADAIQAKVNAALAKGDAALAKGDAALANADRLRAQRIGKLVGRSFDSEKAGRIAEEISQGVEQKLSWVALALLPVFALLLRGMYWREDSYYFAHFVYSLHYHTFCSCSGRLTRAWAS